jgi:hypothetical protein
MVSNNSTSLYKKPKEKLVIWIERDNKSGRTFNAGGPIAIMVTAYANGELEIKKGNNATWTKKNGIGI